MKNNTWTILWKLPSRPLKRPPDSVRAEASGLDLAFGVGAYDHAIRKDYLYVVIEPFHLLWFDKTKIYVATIEHPAKFQLINGWLH